MDQHFTANETSVPMFSEIQHLRVTDAWGESSRYTCTTGGAAFGGRVFIRYEMNLVRSTCLDFVYRGHTVSATTAAAFTKMLAKVRDVNRNELLNVTEVLGTLLGDTICGQFVNTIDSARVVFLNGRRVLTIHWRTSCKSMKCISVFIDAKGDGSVVHEINFYTPVAYYEQTVRHFFDSMRTLQWSDVTPPPMLWQPFAQIAS